MKRNFLAPVLLKYRINYPDEARQMGLEGRVLLAVLINENGNVEKIRLFKSSGMPLLDSAALETAKTFIFSPAMVGGRPVTVWVNIPVEFKFEEVKPDEWLLDVKYLQGLIDKEYDEGVIMDLYKLYKKLIFSPKGSIDLKVNEYIKLVVLKSTADIWDGYWDKYPATAILFVDIIKRFPDSFARFEAEEEFKKFMEKERIDIRNTIKGPQADSLINLLYTAIE